MGAVNQNLLTGQSLIGNVLQKAPIDDNKFSQSYVDDLNTQITYLQNEKLELEEKLEVFMKQVSFFITVNSMTVFEQFTKIFFAWDLVFEMCKR